MCKKLCRNYPQFTIFHHHFSFHIIGNIPYCENTWLYTSKIADSGKSKKPHVRRERRGMGSGLLASFLSSPVPAPHGSVLNQHYWPSVWFQHWQDFAGPGTISFC